MTRRRNSFNRDDHGHRRPKAQQQVAQAVEIILERTRIERPGPRRGTSEWIVAYHVVHGDGRKEEPPLPLREAQARAKQLGATKITIK